jgi:hypothetical protein
VQGQHMALGLRHDSVSRGMRVGSREACHWSRASNRGAKARITTAKARIPTAKARIPTAKVRIPTAKARSPTAKAWIPTGLLECRIVFQTKDRAHLTVHHHRLRGVTGHAIHPTVDNHSLRTLQHRAANSGARRTMVEAHPDPHVADLRVNALQCLGGIYSVNR